MAFVDGETVVPMIPVQDHKRIFDNDQGPNTGGMGAYAPVPSAPPSVVDQITTRVLRPAVEAIRETGLPYRGILYAGIMLTSDGPMCLEFNCRFGDPETQVALPLLETDLVDIITAVVDVELDRLPVTFASRAALSVVMASGGYPGPYVNNKPIRGLETAAKLDAVAVFHAGTRHGGDDGQTTVTDGGRVLSVTATGETLTEARERCYAAVRRIEFEGAHYRTDIGSRALSRDRC